MSVIDTSMELDEPTPALVDVKLAENISLSSSRMSSSNILTLTQTGELPSADVITPCRLLGPAL